MATYTGIKKIKIGDNVFELAVDWSAVTSKPTIPTNTDEKVKTVALTSGTNYYPVLATGANAAANRQVDSTLGGLQYKSTAGTTSAVGTAYLGLGNATASGTANNERGGLQLYSPSTYYTLLVSGNNTANRTISLPNEDGVILLGELGFTTSGNNRAVSRDSNGKLYVTQKDTNTYVTQTANTTVTWRKVLGTYNGGTNATTTVTSGSTNVAYFKNGDGPAFHTSTGAFYATSYFMGLETTDALYTAIDGLGWTADVIL